QVKIRGHRIELGEIETRLRAHPDMLHAAAAVVGEGSHKRLVAFYTPRKGAQLSQQEIKAFLRRQLPEYMTPSQLVKLDQAPLTPSGKIDRKALPIADLLVTQSREDNM